MKNIESMSERELLEEQVRSTRTAKIERRIILVCVLLCTAMLTGFVVYFFAVLVPQMMTTFSAYEDTMMQIEGLLEQLEDVDVEGLKVLISNMQKTLETIDFEKLKATITTLQTMVETLSKFIKF